MLESVCLHVTDFCNLSCEHCWSNSGPNGTSVLRSSSIEKFLLELLPLGLTRISISGGEPLLYEELGSLLRFARARELNVVVTSNGTQLKRLTKLLLDVCSEDANWLSLRISIDGPQEISEIIRGDGTYQKALASLRLIQDSLGASYVNAVVANGNELDTWKTFFLEMTSLNVSEIALITLSPRGRGGILSDEYRRIQNNVVALQSMARESGFIGAIRKWDYLTVDHGYLLVEHDGRIILPGVEDGNDRIFGPLENATTNAIEVFLKENRKRLNYDMNDQKKLL
jgi:MoaA/NifB/PqqE/SkfB family radical SAM enzyme